MLAMAIAVLIASHLEAQGIPGSGTYGSQVVGRLGVIAAGKQFAAGAGMRMLTLGGGYGPGQYAGTWYFRGTNYNIKTALRIPYCYEDAVGLEREEYLMVGFAGGGASEPREPRAADRSPAIRGGRRGRSAPRRARPLRTCRPRRDG